MEIKVINSNSLLNVYIERLIEKYNLKERDLEEIVKLYIQK